MTEYNWERLLEEELRTRDVTDEDRAFHAAWADYNRRAFWVEGPISVTDARDITLMRHFFQAGRQLSSSVPTFKRIVA